MKIEILDAAENDLLDGFRFYDHQAKGLGNYFIDSIFSDIDSLYLYAGIHATYYGFNRLLSRRFPFAIYYKIENKVIRIFAILDCRKNPSWIRDRLS